MINRTVSGYLYLEEATATAAAKEKSTAPTEEETRHSFTSYSFHILYVIKKSRNGLDEPSWTYVYFHDYVLFPKST
ncbi:hypothetical protein [Brevibacillus sp. NRS-1366]|uniref:hypothetical protein n=1 Tax=Brevibacillus sp. NRS-1366 TaxID=3233899 RepID=UPI003D254A03